MRRDEKEISWLFLANIYHGSIWWKFHLLFPSSLLLALFSLSLCVLVLFLIRFTRPYFINSLFLIAYFHCDYFSLICRISLESFYFWQALTVIHIYVLCIFHKEKLCVFFLAMKEKELYAYEIRSVRLHASLVTEHPMRTRRIVVWMGKCFFLPLLLFALTHAIAVCCFPHRTFHIQTVLRAQCAQNCLM